MASELLANPLSPGLSRDPKVKSPWMLKLVERVVDEKLQLLMPKLEELLRQAAASPLTGSTASPLPRSPASSLSKGFMVPPSPSSAENLECGGGSLTRMECQLEAVQREVHALRASFARSSHEVDVLRSRVQEVDNMAIEWEGQMAEIQEEMHGFKMHASKRLRQVSQTLSDNCQTMDGSEEAEKLHCRLHDACAALIASQQVEKQQVEAVEEDNMCQTVSFRPIPRGESNVPASDGPVQQDLASHCAGADGAAAEEETKDSKNEASKNKWRRATAAALLQQAVRSPAARLQQKVRRSAAGKRPKEPTSPSDLPGECQAVDVALMQQAPAEEEDQRRAPAAEVVKKKSSLRVPPLNLTGDGEQKQERAVRRPFFTDELSIDIDSSTVTLFSCNTSCVTSPVNVTSAWSPFSESE